MFDGCETAPGHDLFDVVRLVEGLFHIAVAALPVPDREMLGDRVVRRNIGQRAGDGDRGQRVIGRRLDDRVGSGDHRPQDGHRRNQSAVAGRDVQHPGSEGAHAQFASVAQLVRDPTVEVIQSDLGVGDFGDIVAGKERLQNAVAVLEHFRRQHIGYQ